MSMRTLPRADTGVDLSAPLNTLHHSHDIILDRLRGLAGLPDLVAQAEQARRVATATVALFCNDVLAHHLEEERDLFPAVAASAAPEEERETVKGYIRQLTLQHRAMEQMWKTLEPSIRDIAKGRSATIDAALLERLVRDYMAHARFEEDRFLPLAQAILERNPNHLSAVGLALHLGRAPKPPGYI